MRNYLLEAEASGELTKPVLAVLGALSLALSVLCFLAVREDLPEAASRAQVGLTLLFIGSSSGFMTLFQALVKVYQGRKVRLQAPK